MTKKFDSLSIDPKLIKNLADLNFKAMTLIQEKCLPFALEKKDIIAQAKTGSGKTIAFGLGIINGLELKKIRVQSLMLCPTRELAEQVAKELRTVARAIPNVKILTITGGKSEYQQEKSLSHGAHIIVGTPGRVLRLLKRNVLKLESVTSYVLDEADRMLDMGFSEDIFKISSFVPKDRQTLLFSATFPENIQELSEKLQKDAIHIAVDITHSNTSIVEEFIQLNSHQEKEEILLKILGKYTPERFIVFCKTKRIADSVANVLYDAGACVSSIHSDLEQNERTAVMGKFSNKSLSGVIATDVAARGIDIKELDLVVSFDLPNDPEVYVHRIGRTGRAGNEGRAVSLFTDKEKRSIQDILKYQKKEDCEIILGNAIGEYAVYDIRPAMKTLYISGGKRDKLRPGDIVGAIVGEAGIDVSKIGDISVMNTTSYVAIDYEFAEVVRRKLSSGKIKNKSFKVGIL